VDQCNDDYLKQCK